MDLLSHSIKRGTWAVQGRPHVPVVYIPPIHRPIIHEPAPRPVQPSESIRLPMPPRFARVVVETAKRFDVSPAEIIGTSRKRRITVPRMVAMFIFVERMGATLPQAGRYLQGKDHTTVLHGKRTIARQLEAFGEAIEQIMGACDVAAA